MQILPGIQYLSNQHIDKKKWDDNVKEMANTLIYAHTFYLDNICPGWSALVHKNYDWVLPLTHKKKYGISYLYQPSFTQQLGVFAKENVAIPYEEILKWLQANFKFCEVNWNYSSVVDFPVPAKASLATNLILPLGKNYRSISANYRKSLVNNLKRSSRFNFNYQSSEAYELPIKLYRQLYGDRMLHVTDKDYISFHKIAAHAHKQGMLVCRQVLSKDGDLLAVVLLLNDGKRLYNLMNCTTEAGRRQEANRFLLDSIIKEFAEKSLIFDFEGSDLPGVKQFYENFGAINQPYYMLRYNLLPWPLRLFKK